MCCKILQIDKCRNGRFCKGFGKNAKFKSFMSNHKINNNTTSELQ